MADKVQPMTTNNYYYRIRIGCCFLRCQCQCSPDKHNLRGMNAANTHRDLWFVVPRWSNHGSGFGGGPSCPLHPKGVKTLYRLTNIENSISWDNTPPPCLCLHIHIKILLFIQFISYMFYIFADLFVLMVYIVYFISFFSWEYSYFCFVYIVIVSLLDIDHCVASLVLLLAA